MKDLILVVNSVLVILIAATGRLGYRKISLALVAVVLAYDLLELAGILN